MRWVICASCHRIWIRRWSRRSDRASPASVDRGYAVLRSGATVTSRRPRSARNCSACSDWAVSRPAIPSSHRTWPGAVCTSRCARSVSELPGRCRWPMSRVSRSRPVQRSPRCAAVTAPVRIFGWTSGPAAANLRRCACACSTGRWRARRRSRCRSTVAKRGATTWSRAASMTMQRRRSSISRTVICSVPSRSV